MKIIHLNSYYANGGAGKASLRLNQALQASGVLSDLCVNFSFQEYPNDLSKHWPMRGLRAAKILAERYYSSSKTADKGIPFSVPLFGRDLRGLKALQEADIIHLHWINHAFLHPESINQLLDLNKPLVWTFHDSNAFTGGCHVRYSCHNFERECGNCPVLKHSSPDDLSHRIWLNKQRAYGNVPLTVICPSNWMQESVKRSKMLSLQDTECIPNALDTRIFKPGDKAALRHKLGLPRDKFLLLAGFMPSNNDRHKGSPYLIEALKNWVNDNPTVKGSAELVIFGNKQNEQLPDLPVPIHFLGLINGESNLADCYGAMDVFLAPSLEDNLPNTVMESLACGTPVVAFTTGGIPDMVDHLHNGYLADYLSAPDLALGLQWVFAHQDKQHLSGRAVASVENRFSYPVIAGQHIRLYQRLLDGKRK